MLKNPKKSVFSRTQEWCFLIFEKHRFNFTFVGQGGFLLHEVINCNTHDSILWWTRSAITDNGILWVYIYDTHIVYLSLCTYEVFLEIHIKIIVYPSRVHGAGHQPYLISHTPTCVCQTPPKGGEILRVCDVEASFNAAVLIAREDRTNAQGTRACKIEHNLCSCAIDKCQIDVWKIIKNKIKYKILISNRVWLD